MDSKKYLESLGKEFKALQNRIRYLIGKKHWLTDGEWKESVIRSILRRHLPSSVLVGSGFVLSTDDQTRQIDIIVYKAESPVLFKDGDLVIVTSDAVLGIIEVKTELNQGSFEEAIEILKSNARIVRSGLNSRAFAGIFSYKSASDNIDAFMDTISEVADKRNDRLDLASLGDKFFIKYWESDPSEDGYSKYESWHAYELPNLSFGYFIGNVVNAVCPDSAYGNLWYPKQGKEPYRKAIRRGKWFHERNENHND